MNIFLVEIAGHFPRVFLGATVTVLATKKTCRQGVIKVATTTSHLATNESLNNLEHCTNS